MFYLNMVLNGCVIRLKRVSFRPVKTKRNDHQKVSSARDFIISKNIGIVDNHIGYAVFLCFGGWNSPMQL